MGFSLIEKTKFWSKKFVIPLIAGLAIREFFAPFTGHPYDFELWIRLGYYTARGIDPYSYFQPVKGLSIPGTGPMYSIGFPPLWPLVLAVLYKFYAILGVNNRFVYYFILKQPMILGDMIDAYLIYRLLEKLATSQKAYNAFRFWLFCPFVIIVSSIWGIFDQFVLVFVLLAISFLISSKVKSSVSEAIGITLKAIPIIFLPVLAFSQKNLKNALIYGAMSVATTLAITLLPYVFLPTWHLSGIEAAGTSTVTKVGNSLNYYVIPYVLSGFFPGKITIPQYFGYIWIAGIGLASLLIIWKVMRSKSSYDSVPSTISFMLVVLLVFFLLRTQINEQYVIYFIGLGLFDYYIFAKKYRQKLFHAIWISVLVFLVANNDFLARFLAPISISYTNLANQLQSGVLSDVRYGLMIAAGLAFSIFCLIYLVSLIRDILGTKKKQEIPVAATAS